MCCTCATCRPGPTVSAGGPAPLFQAPAPSSSAGHSLAARQRWCTYEPGSTVRLSSGVRHAALRGTKHRGCAKQGGHCASRPPADLPAPDSCLQTGLNQRRAPWGLLTSSKPPRQTENSIPGRSIATQKSRSRPRERSRGCQPEVRELRANPPPHKLAHALLTNPAACRPRQRLAPPCWPRPGVSACGPSSPPPWQLPGWLLSAGCRWLPPQVSTGGLSIRRGPASRCLRPLQGLFLAAATPHDAGSTACGAV